MTGKQILEEEFEKSGMRGYRADQVDAFLQTVATYVDDVNAKNEDLTYKLQILADKIEEYKKDEESIREALLGAQKLGSSILNEAKAKAEAITKEAKSTSDELLSQAKTKVEIMTKDSLHKANMEIISIKKETDWEQRKLDAMKMEVSNFRSAILKQYKNHLDLLSNLPSLEQPNNEPPIEKKQPVEVQPKETSTEEVVEEKSETIASEMQTITSAIVDSDNNIEEDSKEHTREFNGYRNSVTAPLDLDEKEKEQLKNEFNSRLQRKNNIIEKYGELAFGTHKDSNL
ncbi:DivIVA domain-containing protein [Paludicola sp. MB14-C6]|uniref:DivIVA domain-containing protein n=1 Tax=Paludihabitans sp. MB14-C6 TaxID=3070656 RepID=UPI0027DC4113|nr:DivIVA domain-containing protein [Paludicola sp. MB14-C6]WMJ23113.1 DivIVA domain-containing protein [Paludicola sp. MB14-C6]